MKLTLSKIQIAGIIGILLVGIWFYLNQGTKNKLVYYYSPNCPHCVKFMPIWDSLNVGCGKMKINCDSEKCVGIEVLPTIKLNGVEFQGDRTPDAIKAFVQKHL